MKKKVPNAFWLPGVIAGVYRGTMAVLIILGNTKKVKKTAYAPSASWLPEESDVNKLARALGIESYGFDYKWSHNIVHCLIFGWSKSETMDEWFSDF